MKRYFLIPIIVLVGLFFLTTPLFAQEFTFKKGRKRDAISFDLVHNLIVIPVIVNDQGPFNFILDTGVGPIIITDSLLIDTLATNTVSLFRMRGRGVGPELEAYIINDLTAEIGKATMNDFSAVLLKNDPFQLSAYMGIPIHGIIGAAFFKSFIVKLNYIAKRMTFYNPSKKIKNEGQKIPMQLIREKPFINVLINTEKNTRDSLLLLIDSGAGHAISLDLIEKQERMQPKKTIEANLGMGLGGPISGLIGRLPEVKIDDFSFKSIITAFPVYEDEVLRSLMTERNGSIGGEILKRFTVIFVYSRNELHLKKNKNYKDPFEHDMSGMEVYKHKGSKGRFFIGRIEPDSPADRAQFLTNDEILSINLKPTKEFSLNDINLLLQKETIHSLIFEVLRGDQVLFKFLDLKRRI